MHGWRSAAPRPHRLPLLLIVLGMVFIAAANTKYVRLTNGSWWATISARNDDVHRIELGRDAVKENTYLNALSSPTTATAKLTPVSFTTSAGTENCELIKSMLALLAANRPNDASFTTEGMLDSSTTNDLGVTFFCKVPLVRTVVNGKPVILLRYQAFVEPYKFNRTLDMLREVGGGSGSMFPELVAHCHDAGDSFRYIVEEFLPLYPKWLPRPQNFTQCVARLKQVVQMYVTMDEDFHMAMIDPKKGQWMARTVDEFVLPDVDDVARCPIPPWFSLRSLNEYNQTLSIIRPQLPENFTRQQTEDWLNDTMFPRGVTIRYTVLTLHTFLMQDLGMPWDNSTCADPPSVPFLACMEAVFKWTSTVHDDWPAPKQVLQAIDECSTKGSFTRTRREPAEWRDGF